MSEKRDWYTLAEAAKEIGVSRQRMHQIVHEMNAKTTLVNPRLSVISRAELTKIQKARKKLSA